MLPYRDSRFTTVALVVFFILALGYALFEARGIILGPTITVSGEVSDVHEQFVMIKGAAQRISLLSMNGKPVQVTKEGAFAESYLLAPGYNRIVLNAKDQYGRTTERVLEIIYTPAGQSPLSGASSANSSATSTLSSSSTAPLAQ